MGKQRKGHFIATIQHIHISYKALATYNSLQIVRYHVSINDMSCNCSVLNFVRTNAEPPLYRSLQPALPRKRHFSHADPPRTIPAGSMDQIFGKPIGSAHKATTSPAYGKKSKLLTSLFIL